MKINGKGTYTWTSGVKYMYEGEWEYGFESGQGTVFLPMKISMKVNGSMEI